MNKITIVTITWNASAVLKRTLESVAAQENVCKEHIIIDGASTDGTLEMLEAYRTQEGENYPILIVSEKDKGLYDAMNKGIERAEGDYMVFLNAGDKFHTSDTLNHVAVLATSGKEEPAVIYGDTDIVDDEGTFLRKRHLIPPEKLSWKSFKMGMMVCHQAFYVRTEIAKGIKYDLTYKLSADFDWCIRIMKEAASLGLPLQNMHEVAVDYLDGGLSDKRHRESLNERFAIMAKHYGLLPTVLRHVWFACRQLRRKVTMGLVVMASVLMMLTVSCSENKAKESVLFVSIEPLRFFTEQIAGNHFQVISLIPEGQQPESYDPSPQQLVELASAKGFVAVGNLGFENTWLEKIQSLYPNVRIFDSSSGMDGEGVQFDSHTWTSPQSAETIARNICCALQDMDVESIEFYEDRLDSLLRYIHGVDEKVSKLLKGMEGTAFAIAHPSLTRFAEQYGLKQFCIEQAGKEPTPQSMLELVRKCRENNVKVILVQPEFGKQNAEALAREIGGTIVEINPLTAEWGKEMIRIAQVLRDGRETD